MKTEPTLQKLRGGYYTPPTVTDFLAEWAIRSPNDRVLEPSAGDGNILLAAALRLIALGHPNESVHSLLTGVELDPTEAKKAASRLEGIGVRGFEAVETNDFFHFAACQLSIFAEPAPSEHGAGKFHAVIGNPPFIRYQNFPEEHRQVAFRLMEERGFRPNRLTNAWLPFLVLGAHLAADNGRLAMVIPAELFQVKYAAEARQFLSDFFASVTLVTFKSLLFPDVQQEVVLLLAEKRHATSRGIRTIELDDAADLGGFSRQAVEQIPVKPLDHTTEKWTKYFLDADEIDLLRETRTHPGVIQSGEAIDVNVGVVTGNNGFFILRQEDADTFELEDSVIPIVTRSAHLTGVRFTPEDWEHNRRSQVPSLLFKPADDDVERLSKGAAAYIREGERNRQHVGYKCRIRKRWYIAPSLSVPDAFMLRQVHGFPKLVLNETGVTCTDTIHRVDFLNGYRGETVVAAFLNSLTFAHSEIKGRSYGGGVLTFEPSEAEELPLPLRNADNLDIARIDGLLRQGKIEEVLDITDQVLLVDGIGLQVDDVRRLRAIWHKLRDRRLNRRNAKWES